jgi:hypothetical protein
VAASPNPVAAEHLPFFVTPPGQTDVLYNISLVFIIAMIVLFGVIFLTIHSLPERLAHKTKKVQLDIVAVLGLLALLTNEHIFWVAALLLAYIDFPDFSTPFNRIAAATEAMAAEATGEPPADRAEPVPPKVVPPDQLPRDKKGAAHA